jgi:hypothetical protein
MGVATVGCWTCFWRLRCLSRVADAEEAGAGAVVSVEVALGAAEGLAALVAVVVSVAVDRPGAGDHMATMTLEELVRQLSLAHGQSLRCVALYGSTARGEQVARRPNLNVLVLVDAIDMAHLQREAAVARAWREAGHPPPLTLTVAEWHTSADIFPIEYADILAHYRVLHGALPGEIPVVRRGDLRLQLEHEAQSKLLRLRHGVLASGAEPRALLAMLEESASSIMTLLRAALRVAGEEPPAESGTVIDRLEKLTGIPGGAFRSVLGHSRGHAKAKESEAVALTTAYLVGVGALVDWIDVQVPP